MSILSIHFLECPVSGVLSPLSFLFIHPSTRLIKSLIMSFPPPLPSPLPSIFHISEDMTRPTSHMAKHTLAYDIAYDTPTPILFFPSDRASKRPACPQPIDPGDPTGPPIAYAERPSRIGSPFLQRAGAGLGFALIKVFVFS